MIAVVGESHYQDALRDAAGGQWSDEGIFVEAAIVREPTNHYDPNAVRIDILGRTVGYIARTEAPLLGPGLLALDAAGLRPVCRARVLGGSPHKPSYGVVLHASFALSRLANNPPTGPVFHVPPSKPVTVTGEEEHQDLLDQHAPASPDEIAYVFVTLDFCTISKGTHKGEQTVEVQLDGRRVGQLTHLMGQRYVQLVSDGLATGKHVVAQAFLRRESKIELYLLMP